LREQAVVSEKQHSRSVVIKPPDGKQTFVDFIHEVDYRFSTAVVRAGCQKGGRFIEKYVKFGTPLYLIPVTGNDVGFGIGRYAEGSDNAAVQTDPPLKYGLFRLTP
jgi:hypothetical protein